MITTIIIIAVLLGVGALAYGVSYHTGVQKKIEKNVVSAYNKIEDSVVSGYKNIENSVVSGYKKIENVFVPSDANSKNK